MHRTFPASLPARLIAPVALFVAMSMHHEARASNAVSDSAKAASYVRERLMAWVEQSNRSDAGANEVWAPGVKGWFPSGPEFGDSAAFAVAGVPIASGIGSSTWEITVDEVDVGGNIAACHDIWTETRHFKGHSETARRVIHGSELWRRQPDGKWRIARWVSAPEHWQGPGR